MKQLLLDIGNSSARLWFLPQDMKLKASLPGDPLQTTVQREIQQSPAGLQNWRI